MRNFLRPIDRTTIELLRSIRVPGEPDIVSQVINVYLSEAETIVANLVQATKEKDFSEVKRLVSCAQIK